MLFRTPLLLYRARLGWLLGERFLLLAHVGRRSGRRYFTVVEVLGHDAAGEYLVMSGCGRTADWYRNVIAGGAVEVLVARRHSARPCAN